MVEPAWKAPYLERHIRDHVDHRSLTRGAAYSRQRKVLAPWWDGERLGATVVGGEPYDVSVAFAGPRVVTSACSCPVGYACKHVAALLYAVLEQRVAVSIRGLGAAARLPTMTPARVVELAVSLGLDDLLDQPSKVASTALGGSAWWAWNLTLRQMLSDGSWERYRSAELRPPQCERLASWLQDEARERKKALDEAAEAEAWRSVPPEEPALVPLWTALRRWIAASGEAPSRLVAPALVASAARVQADPPALIVTEETPRVILVEPGADPEWPRWVLERALDVLTRPELYPTQLRTTLVEVATQPRWERLIAALDQAVGHAAVEDPTVYGWRLSRDASGPARVDAVKLQPYARRAGFRTARAELDEVAQLSAQDREAVAALAQVPYLPHALAFGQHARALAALVGHPRVVSWDGHPLAVRMGSLTVGWVPDEAGGVRVEPRVDGRPLGQAGLGALLTSLAGTSLVLVEADHGRCTVLTLSRAAIRVLEQLAARGLDLPAEARPALLERFPALDAAIPVALEGGLRGEEIAADPRPLIRLTASPDGALDLELWARPVPDGRPWPPGEGPDVVSVIEGDRRRFATRDRSTEPARFQQALAPLGLPEPVAPHRWELLDPERALRVVEALQEREASFQAEWVNLARVLREATASDLKVRASSGRDWFGLGGGLEVDGEVVSLADLLEAVRKGRRFVRVSAGAWVAISARLAEQLAQVAAVTWTSRSGVEITPLGALALDAVEAAGASIAAPPALRVRREHLVAAADLEVAVPDGLHAELRPYQVEGLAWLARLSLWSPGAVLADDMGLGKTIQALALLLRRASVGPALVVAPASVGLNWIREAERFAPSLRVRMWRGTDRGALLEGLGPSDLLVTSWDLMTRDAERLKEVGFATVVLDEAQAIKNAETERARASATLRGQFTVALTGTPVENRVGEVWSLLRTVVPGLFGPAERFREAFVRPIDAGLPGPAAALSTQLRPFVLRRLKSQVARDLPERSEITVPIELSTDERAHYQRFQLAAIAEMTATVENEQARRMRLLAALTRLRQLACDPRLVYPEEVHAPSSKLERLRRLVSDLRESGHRVLVFSQFTSLLALARAAIEADGAHVRYLDGSTPIKKRQVEVDAFQRGEGDAFLISLKAGGTGLNLTAATYVIHLDPWWNPAVEDQATDRAHRIGQTQPVTVYRLVATGTIEEEVLALHAAKRQLVADLLDGTGNAALGSDELLALLRGGGADVEAGSAPVRARAAKVQGAPATPAPTASKPHEATQAAPPEVAATKAPGPPDWLGAFRASLDAEQAAGAIQANTHRVYVAALERLVAHAGPGLTDPRSVRSAADAYLAAVAEGRTPSKSDKVFGPPVFRRLVAWLEARGER